MREVASILAPKDSYVVLNLYSNGYSAVLADTLIKTAFRLNGTAKKGDGSDKKSFELTYGELVLQDKFEKALPLSVFTRLKR